MTFSGGFCVFFSLISMIMDIRWEKVSNRWILFGWLAAAAWQTCGKGPGGVLFFLAGALFPIGLLFPLFASKMLGTGDIKLFSVLGGMMGPRSFLSCLLLSFILAAAISLPVLLIRCDVKERLRYFAGYMARLLSGQGVEPYLKPGRRPENIHFTIPVFISVLLCAGGFKL